MGKRAQNLWFVMEYYRHIEAAADKAMELADDSKFCRLGDLVR
jgi:hypothetical protein